MGEPFGQEGRDGATHFVSGNADDRPRKPSAAIRLPLPPMWRADNPLLLWEGSSHPARHLTKEIDHA